MCRPTCRYPTSLYNKYSDLQVLLFPQGDDALLQALHCNLQVIKGLLQRMKRQEEYWAASRRTFENDYSDILLRNIPVITGLMRHTTCSKGISLDDCPSDETPRPHPMSLSHNFGDMEDYLLLKDFKAFVEFVGHTLADTISIGGHHPAHM